MNARKILIVDDEARLVDVLKAYLERDGYKITTANNGRDALLQARREKPDLILLDLMLPEVDGLDVCRTLRRESDVPIIMLTARSEETDKLIGLELGADDYITKPFSPREVVARVRTVLRRSQAAQSMEQETITVGDLIIDQARHEVRRDDEIISITPTEFDLLWALASNKGRVLSRLQLMEKGAGRKLRGLRAHYRRPHQEPTPQDRARPVAPALRADRLRRRLQSGRIAMHSLSLKLVVAFVAVALVSVAVVALAATRATDAAFTAYVRQNQSQRLQTLQAELADYYARSQSWANVQPVLDAAGGSGMGRMMGQDDGLGARRTGQRPGRDGAADDSGRPSGHNHCQRRPCSRWA